MPNRWAVANGNWSSTATWNSGGSLGIPTGSDDVFSNNFTVVVDQSFSVLSLRSAASASAIVAGGSFNFNSGSISGSCTNTIANTALVPGATNLIQVTATTGTVTLTLGSSVVPRTATNDSLINHSGNCNFNLTGNTFASQQGGGATGVSCIAKTSGGTIIITGDLLGGAGGSAGVSNNHALNSSNGNTTVIGNITGGSGTSIGGAGNNGILQTAGNLNVTGNILGGPGSGPNVGVSFSGTTLTVIGSVTGGTVAIGVSTSATNINISGSVVGVGSVTGLSCTSAANISVTGSITPSSSATAISLSGASTFTYSGSLASSANSPAIISTNASATNIFTGPFINTNDTMAVQCVDMVLTQDASTFWNFGNITLYSPERLAYYPSSSDIRQGTTYADGTVSGSLAMPPPTAVIAGTPTDNTTGSAVLTPAQLQDAVWGRDLSQMTETGSIGYRLAKSATTDSTGNQIASYLI